MPDIQEHRTGLSHPDSPARQPRSLPSVRTLLIWVVVACLLPAAIGIGTLVSYLYHEGRDDLQKTTLLTTRALSLAIDVQLSDARDIANVLATSPFFIGNDWPGFRARASALMKMKNIGKNIVVSDASGQTILNTMRPMGEALPMFGDLAHIRRVVATGKPVISDLFTGAVTGQQVVAVSVPVLANGAVTHVVSVVIPVPQLNAILARQPLPQHWLATITDASGIIVARTSMPEQFVGRHATALFMQHMRAPVLESVFELTTLDGIPSRAFYRRSASSGWSVTLAIPRAMLEAQLICTIAWFGLGIVLLFAIAIGAAWLMAERIARSVQALTTLVDATGTDQVLSVAKFHFIEAANVAQSLQASLVELKASEENYRILVDGSPDAIVLHQDGKVLSVNPAFVKAAGDRSAQDWTGRSILDSIDPAFHSAVLARITLLANAEVGAALPIAQITCRKLDGTSFHAEIQSVPVDYHGKRAVHTTLRDITKRKKAEAERLADALFYRQLLEQLPIGVFLRNWQGQVVDVNPAFAAMLGRSDEQLRGMTNAQLSAPEMASLDAQQMETVHISGAYGPYEKEYLRPDGTRVPVLSRGRLVQRNGETLILSVAQDMTDKRKAEFQLAQAQKMDAIGQLTGGLAHDFNNMLGVIIGNLDLLGNDLLANGLDADSAAKGRVDTALTAALRGADLTRALLSVARAQAVVAEPVDLTARLNELLPLLRHTAGPDIDVVVMLADGPVVQIDSSGLAGTLLNLVINARDAMPGGGRLTVALRVRAVEPGDGILTLAPGRYAALSVTDNGSGMSADVLASAMLPFFTTKERGRGTGLGLAMAYGFVKQCGGELLLYSEVGHGTTVKLILPLADADATDAGATQGTAPLGAPVLARGTERVLVVDDEIELLAVTTKWLKLLGYDVTPCASGASALAALADAQAAGRPYALMVSDVIMPGMDGFALADAARARQSDLALLYVSGFADGVARGRSRPSGAILEKPFRQAELAARVRSALEL